MSFAPAQKIAVNPPSARKRALAAALIVAALVCWGVVFMRQRSSASAQEHIQAGIAAAQQAQARRAETEWRLALAQDPKNADAYLLLGELFLSTHEWDKGVETFQSLLKLNPDAPHAHGDLATCLYQYGDQMGAYKEAEEELKRDADHIPSLVIAARMASALSHKDQTDAALQRLTTLLPTNTSLLKLYAESLVYSNRSREADPVLERFIAAAPNDPQAYSLRGVNRFNSDASPEGAAKAEADFRRAVQLSPTTPISHLYLGKLYRRQGQKQKALAELETAYRLAPDTIAVTFELSQLYEQMGLREKAAQLRQQLIALRQEDDLKNTLQKRCVGDRDNFENHLRLGQILLKNGAIHDATYYLSRAALLRPKDAAAQAALQELSRVSRSAPPEQDVASRLLTEQAASPGNP